MPLLSSPSTHCLPCTTPSLPPLCRHYAFRSLVNYGALPQTYEDPEHKDEWTGEMGDGDPIDVCDISTGLRVHTGSVYSVKVLGALALLDGGETDWKILAVRTDDPRAGSVSDIKTAPADVLRLADDIRAWFRTYKVPEGKPENEFAFGGAWQDRDTALAIIESTHKQWRSLLQLEQNMPATLYGKQALKSKCGATWDRGRKEEDRESRGRWPYPTLAAVTPSSLLCCTPLPPTPYPSPPSHLQQQLARGLGCLLQAGNPLRHPSVLQGRRRQWQQRKRS